MSQSAAAPLGERRRIVVAFIVAFAFLMQGMDTTLLTIAIPTIAEALAVDPLLLHLAITGYLVSLAVFMPVSGWFADKFGARRVFCAALVVFTLGSLLAAMAPNLSLLVAARVVQGFGGALMTPVGRLLVLKAFGPGRTLDAMTYLTLPVLIGPLLGPLLGATIISFASWRMLFLVSMPLCLLTIVLTLRFIPALPVAGAKRFDLPGFLMVAASLVLFQLGVEHLAHPVTGLVGTLGIFTGAVLIFVAYMALARGRAHAALDLSLFANQRFSVGVIAGGIGRVGLNSSAFLLPLTLQIGYGMTPIMAALITSISAVGAFLAKPLLRRAIAMIGYGGLLMTVTVLGSGLMVSFFAMDAQSGLVLTVAAVLALGAIRTMHFNAVNSLTYSDVPDDKLSSSVASAGVFQQLAMGLGISFGATVLSFLVADGHLPQIADFQHAFLFMGLIPLLSLPILLTLVTANRKPKEAGQTV
ncbi:MULTISPECIES: MFS transporter [Devosia]|uniref:MFS transporter n=1 Tax=Devosia TaxID=46913 RepID=UPI000CE994D7|nr:MULTISPECIES: MFS transporter [Devosia]AVF05155.1 MFS transporter [Devosia sp. I507]